MKVSFKSILVMGLVSFGGLASLAHADDNGQIQSLDSFKNAYQNYASTQSNDASAQQAKEQALEAQLHQLVQDEATAKQESQQEATLKSQTAQLQANLDKARGLLEEAGGDADVVRADENAFQRIGNFVGKNPQQIKDEKAAEKAYKEAEDALKNNQSQIIDLNTKVVKYQSECDARTKQAQTIVAQITQISNSLNTSKNQGNEQLADAANSYAQNLYLNMKMKGYDAKFILTDLNQLQAENKLSQGQMDALKANIDQLMENTLLAKYVNDQISAAMKNGICDAQNRCAVGATTSGSNQVQASLVSPVDSTLPPQVTSSTTKVDPIGCPPGAPKPAGAAGSASQ
jgi:hypothetical protein